MNDVNDGLAPDLVDAARRTYNAPPVTPREEMWAAIEAARGGDIARRRDRRRPPASRWTRVGIGIAAALLVGVGLGRMSRGGPALPTLPAAVSVGEATSGATTAYGVAAAEHLGRTEALLTTFHSQAMTGALDAELHGWATDLLSSTRMLLDSPATEDPALRVLLEDLELILAQISQLPVAGDTQAQAELDIVRDAIEQADVLPKLRTAAPESAGPQRSPETQK